MNCPPQRQHRYTSRPKWSGCPTFLVSRMPHNGQAGLGVSAIPIAYKLKRLALQAVPSGGDGAPVDTAESAVITPTIGVSGFLGTSHRATIFPRGR